MRKSQEQIKERFENMYQDNNTPWTSHASEPALSKFLEFLKSENQIAKILDIGCGDGWISIKAAKLNFEVWGIDSSKTAISEAKQSAKEEGVDDKTKFKVGDALNLPYEKNLFDALMDRGFFHHILPENRDKYFENILRVLKKDSYIYLSVFSNKNSLGVGNRFSKQEIQELFSPDFKIIEFAADPYPNNAPAHLLHFVLERK